MSDDVVFEIHEWLEPSSSADALEGATMCSMSIRVGDQNLTEVSDRRASTIRDYVRLPAGVFLEWLLMNWWRLRWEPEPQQATYQWLECHNAATISTEYAWPPIELSSDGATMSIRVGTSRDDAVSPVRYLSTGTSVRVPIAAFETACTNFATRVLERLALREPGYRDLQELWDEVERERRSPDAADRSRIAALGGYDPGHAPWLDDAIALRDTIGAEALDEVAATLGGLDDRFAKAKNDVYTIEHAKDSIDLSSFRAAGNGANGWELPWQHGARLAQQVRKHLGMEDGPIPDNLLVKELGNDFFSAKDVKCELVSGAFRSDLDRNVCATTFHSNRPSSRRFYVARIIGHSLFAPSDRLIAVTDTKTSTQQLQRSFAQELLCPWRELEEYVRSNGDGEDAIANVADRYGVSEYLVLTTLVNRHAIGRERLPKRLQ
jgi:Zn-dependent peptidase ImmA (M78 family)